VVVLGLSEFHPEEGYAVLNFHPRLDAAAELAANGQVEDLVVSGLPEQADAMAAELMRRGVTQRITRDPYGWRTLDSVARARAAYPGRTLVFVSQGWHNDRAIWIARRMGVESYGYPAKNGPDLRSWAFAPVRDVLAKGKAMIDWASGFRLATDVPPAEGNR
jgi:SanA protein